MSVTYDDVFPKGGVRPRGLFFVTGEPGVGKSTFCWTVGVSPDRICVFDFESSLSSVHDQVGFGLYKNMVSEWALDRGLVAPPRDLYSFMMGEIARIEPGKYDLIIIDNIDYLEAALQDVVENNPEAFGLTKGQLEKGRGLKWGAIKKLYAVFIQMLNARAPLVGFTSHLRQVWAGGQPVPGLFQPKGKKDVLEAQTFLRIWLLPRPDGPEPMGLVLKSRLSITRFGDNGVEIKPVLPRKLPIATWAKIREYFKNPADLAHPTPEERLTDDDAHKLRGTLSRDQLDLVKALIAAQEREIAAMTRPSNTGEFILMVKDELGLELDDALKKLGKDTIADVSDPFADYQTLKALVSDQQ